MVDEKGDDSERCLKWNCGGRDFLWNLSENVLK